MDDNGDGVPNPYVTWSWQDGKVVKPSDVLE